MITEYDTWYLDYETEEVVLEKHGLIVHRVSLYGITDGYLKKHFKFIGG